MERRGPLKGPPLPLRDAFDVEDPYQQSAGQPHQLAQTALDLPRANQDQWTGECQTSGQLSTSWRATGREAM